MASQLNPSPRAARTRAALIAAGFDLLVERSIDAIPIDDLVAKAGVAKGSFFNHFTATGFDGFQLSFFSGVEGFTHYFMKSVFLGPFGFFLGGKWAGK